MPLRDSNHLAVIFCCFDDNFHALFYCGISHFIFVCFVWQFIFIIFSYSLSGSCDVDYKLSINQQKNRMKKHVDFPWKRTQNWKRNNGRNRKQIARKNWSCYAWIEISQTRKYNNKKNEFYTQFVSNCVWMWKALDTILYENITWSFSLQFIFSVSVYVFFCFAFQHSLFYLPSYSMQYFHFVSFITHTCLLWCR